ncbi:MAG: NUDIX domain-containing protein [Tissierellia bacterium]|nr:NUDIX domain-containing protein [Tissierellia bacterium]
MEYWELYDETLKPLNKVVPRGSEIKPGEYFRVCGVICINREGKILTTKRSMEKESNPGYWEFTCGTLEPGEDPIKGAIRELEEETGIVAEPSALKYLGTLKEEKKFSFIYLYLCREKLKDLVLQKEEVSDAKFLSRMYFLSKLYGDSYAPPMKRRLVHFFKDYQEFLI